MLHTRRTRSVASAPLQTMTRLCSSQNNDTPLPLQSRIMAMVKLWCQRFFVFGDFDDELFVDAFFDLLEKFEGIHAMQRVAVALKSDLTFRIQQRESGTDSAGGTPTTPSSNSKPRPTSSTPTTSSRRTAPQPLTSQPLSCINLTPMSGTTGSTRTTACRCGPRRRWRASCRCSSSPYSGRSSRRRC